MRHLVDGKKLGRTTAHRKAMFANMAVSLINLERIETTLPKAKELKRFADKLVTLGKKQNLNSRRIAISLIKDSDAVAKLFNELAKRYATRNGGYTRIMKLGWRHGDCAPMAMIEYLNDEKALAEGEKNSKVKKTPAKKAPAKKAKSADAPAKVEKKAKSTKSKK